MQHFPPLTPELSTALSNAVFSFFESKELHNLSRADAFGSAGQYTLAKERAKQSLIEHLRQAVVNVPKEKRDLET